MDANEWKYLGFINFKRRLLLSNKEFSIHNIDFCWPTDLDVALTHACASLNLHTQNTNT